MYSVQLVTSDGTLERIVLSIEYFEKGDISLYRNTGETPLIEGIDWAWDTDKTVYLLTGPEPVGSTIMIRRMTDKNRAYNIYDGGAAFSRESLDENFLQLIYLAQEFTEGSGLTGLYRPFNMNGYRITNVGTPIDPADATTKAYVDTANAEQDTRINGIANSFIGVVTASYPYETVLTAPTDTVNPSYTFDKAWVYLDGLKQAYGSAYVVVDNTLLFAEVLPAGTVVSAVLGEDVFPGEGVVSTGQFTALKDVVDGHTLELTQVDTRLDTLETEVQPVSRGGTGASTADGALANLGGASTGVGVFKAGTAAAVQALLGYAAAGANTDITSLAGLTTPLSVAQGGLGNTAGRAATATKLDVPRGVRVNLASTTAVNFDGSADITPGVTGVLALANGGTGASTAPAGRTALGAAASGANTDITSLQGVVDGTAAATGKVGEVLTSTGSQAAYTSATTVNAVSLALPPGDWEVTGVFTLQPTGGSTAVVQSSINTVSATFAAFPHVTMLGGNSSYRSDVRTRRRINVATNTTVYLTGYAEFNTGTATMQGYLEARRTR